MVGSTPQRSVNRPKCIDTRRLRTLDNTGVIEICRQLATEEEDEPYGIGVTLACLQQAGKLPRSYTLKPLALPLGLSNRNLAPTNPQHCPLVSSDYGLALTKPQNSLQPPH